MKKVLLLLALLILASCSQQNQPAAGTPFLGGQQGLTIQFLPDSPPIDVYDGGQFPFNAVVKVQNQGEWLVPKDKIRVLLEGVRPEEFGSTPAAFRKNPPEDLIPRRKEPQTGNIIESTPVFVEYNALNHQQPIVGSGLTYPLRAELCYNYGTIATSKLCSRSNILNPTASGVCVIDQQKTVYNSGAPVIVSNLREVARGVDKIGFTFGIQHSGSGRIFKLQNDCDKSLTVRSHENKVKVTVQSDIQGLTCESLGSNVAEGFVTLFNNQATVTCTQTITNRADYEFPVRITLTYDYEDSATTAITVKRSQ